MSRSRRPPRREPEPAGDEAVARQLAASLESTRRGLESFLASLKASGMPEALDGYRHLQSVLFQQRLWAHAGGRGELDAPFAAVGAVAAEIHAVLAPYAEVMREIGDVGRISGAAAPVVETAAVAPTAGATAAKPPRRSAAGQAGGASAKRGAKGAARVAGGGSAKARGAVGPDGARARGRGK